MSITLSCGCVENDFDRHHSVIVKSYSRDCSRALDYMTVCGPCKQRYADHGLLTTEQEGMKWMLEDENQ